MRTLRLALTLFLLASPALAQDELAPGLRARPLAAPSGDPAGPRFRRLAPEETGVRFVNPLPPTLAETYERGGVALADLDGDGLCDLILSSGGAPAQVYRNLGGLRFEPHAAAWGLDLPAELRCSGIAPADVDGDGDLDLYACLLAGANRLFLNRGDGRLEEAGEAWGVAYVGASVMAAFSDYDRDGDLDFYLVTTATEPDPPPRSLGDVVRRAPGGELVRNPRYLDSHTVLERPDGTVQLVKGGQRDRLFRNEGGRFRDVSDEAGIAGHDPGNAATWWDYDQDGWPDLYVCNDWCGPDRLYRNRRDGRFEDVTAAVLPHVPWFSMSADSGDLDGDGRTDLLVADMAATDHLTAKVSMGEMNAFGWFLAGSRPRQAMRNALFLSTTPQRCREAASLTRLARTNWSWSVQLADLDADGALDVLVTNGNVRNYMDADLQARAAALRAEGKGAEAQAVWETAPPRRETNLVYRNLGGLRFLELARAWGLDHRGISFGAALADLDRDGDLDLVVNHLGESPGIYRNDSQDRHTLLVRLQGRASNRWGLGARVSLSSARGRQVRRLHGASGYCAVDEPLLAFGLGGETRVHALEIEWPSGRRQRLGPLPGDRFLEVVEPEAAPAGPGAEEPPPAPLFVARAGAAHEEWLHDDFARQPLLPWRLSQLGPGLAVGDVDGDAREDVVRGGAAGYAGRVAPAVGGHAEVRAPALEADVRCEDQGLLLFEADGDGDLDLLVVSGGVEAVPNSEALGDRLYLNDGGGRFTRAPAAQFPPGDASGGVACAADVDRDGDLDLFIGGRLVPGAYPRPGRSRLLRNTGGRFRDVTQELAPGLTGTGMVTSALWSDVDGDGWVDLLVAHEWGPLRLFRNREGRLEDVSRAAGLEELRGWWTSIAGGDLDGDGDLDYVLGNLGLNTPYRASAAEPCRLYHGDLDGRGGADLVEATLSEGHWVPRRGLSCSSAAMPGVRERCPTFRSFAQAALEEIYAPEALGAALQLEATQLASGLLLNLGGGRFAFRALPRVAQLAPVLGAVVCELDGDGAPDLALVGNFFTTQPETPRFDGGLGLVLRGDGAGGFQPLEPGESGMHIAGDARSLVVADLDGDPWPDLVASVNAGRSWWGRNRGRPQQRMLVLRLEGPAGNPSAVGARVEVTRADGRVLSGEVHAGGGYLGQSSPLLWFGLGRSRAQRLRVRWPDGRTRETREGLDATRVVLRQP